MEDTQLFAGILYCLKIKNCLYFMPYMKSLLFAYLTRAFALAGMVFLLCLQGNVTLYLQTVVDTSTTNTSLRIQAETTNAVLLSFSITPTEIYSGDDISFTLSNAHFLDNSIASNLPCRLVITPPDNVTVIFSGITDNVGKCKYDTRETLSNQGLVLVQNTIDTINKAVGNGSAYSTVTYNGNVFTSNTVAYKVNEKRLQIGNFTVQPKIIDKGDQLIFKVTPITFQNGQPASNLPAILSVSTPSGRKVVIRVITDSQGGIILDSSQSLADQGYTLISGNYGDLNNTSGAGFGNVQIEYGGVIYSTNDDSYQVRTMILPFPTPLDPIIPILVRTGGAILPYGIGIGIFLMIVGFLKISLGKDKE
jgi:hypothetical protein